MIELNRFYVGESTKFMQENVENDFIDLTVTSPPYDNLRKYNGFVFDYKSMLGELYRITKNGGVVIWIVGDKTENGSESLTSFKQALYAKEIGFNIHDTMIYKKQNPLPLVQNRYGQCFEYMFVFSKGTPKTFNPITVPCKYAGISNWGKRSVYKDDSDMSVEVSKKAIGKEKIHENIFEYLVGSVSGTGKIKHPAMFPEKLASDCIISWSNEGEIIFDPMCGSGTTCKMAYLNNRKFIGIDTSEEYINNICIPRLEQYIK